MATSNSMTTEEALSLLKALVSSGHFRLEARSAVHASPVTTEMAKIIVANLTLSDFDKCVEDSASKFHGEYLWIFKPERDDKYYLKVKFIQKNSFAKFVSFHIAQY